MMKETIAELETEGSNSNTVAIYKSKLLATQHKTDEAIQYFSKNISYFTEDSKLAFAKSLELIELKYT